MSKPDFEKMAKRAMDQWDINRIYGAVVYELQAAYSLGLDRAAEIAEREGGYDDMRQDIRIKAGISRIIDAIRAEGEKS